MYLQHIPVEFFVFCAGIFGAAAGSFFHVCVWRIPRGESVVTPSSRCPKCGREIEWRENLPILSYLFLGGKSKCCGDAIHPRYLIYECLTALLFMGIVYQYFITYTAFVYLVVVSVLVIASGIDWDYYFIPDFLSIPMTFMAVVAAATAQYFPAYFPKVLVSGVTESLWGIVVGGGVIWSIRILGSWVFRQEAMGFGDVKLMAFIGGFIGWDHALLAIFLASLYASVYGLTLRYTGKIEKYGHVYFGPFLSLGAYTCLLVGQPVLDWYLRPFRGF